MAESVFGGKGRPTNDEQRQRTARFLSLVAGGSDGESAAREAGLSPWRALRIVTEASFLDVVQAIRDLPVEEAA